MMDEQLVEHLAGLLSGLMVPYSIDRRMLGTAGPHLTALWDRYGGTTAYPSAADFKARILAREQAQVIPDAEGATK